MNPIERAIDRVDPRLSIRLRLVKKRLQGELLLKVLDRLVRPGVVAVDVGANRGVYTHRMAQRVGSKGRVFAVEPFPTNVARLRTAFGRWANVTVIDAALSDRDGRAELHVPRYRGETLDALGTLHATEMAHETLEVRLRTLDEVVADAGAVSFVKCDVEGHERAVLRGGERTLRGDRPPLLVEVEQRHQQEPIQETFDLLADLGYHGYFLDGEALRPLSGFDVQRHQLSFLGDGFVPYAMPAGYVSDFLFIAAPLDGLPVRR